jgi:polysaccharide export outer membrane protein
MPSRSIFLAAALLLATIATPMVGAGAAIAAPPAAPGAATTATTTAYNYILGPGDVLRITVYGEVDLSGPFSVAGDGRISFPLIGDVAASGKTVRQVQDEITAALADRYLKDPKVSAEVMTFRPYFILGEVNRPGQFPYTDGISVLNAIAAAGGYSYRGDEKYIYLRRETETSEHKVRLTPELQVEPGETIRVGRRFF